VFGAIEKPLPRPSEDSAPFWEAAFKGELRMQKCGGCGHVRFPPSLLCPRCLSEDAQWVQMSGRGKVYSWVVVHQSQHPAFNPDAPVDELPGPREASKRRFRTRVKIPSVSPRRTGRGRRRV